MMDYLDYMEEALSELKRAEHSIYVSLKYSRTIDVINFILDRIKRSYEMLFHALYAFLYENNQVQESNVPFHRKLQIILEKVDDEKIENAYISYKFLKLLEKKKYFIENRFRRYFGVVYILDGSYSYMMDIDNITQWFFNLKDNFLGFEEYMIRNGADITRSA